MDPVGFALENFDAVGAWRTREAGRADRRVRATGGRHARGRRRHAAQAILDRPELFVGTMTEKLLTYALGRGVEAHDMPAVRRIVRDAAANDYRFSSLVLGIVNSVPFQMRMKPVAEPTSTRLAAGSRHVSGSVGVAVFEPQATDVGSRLSWKLAAGSSIGS